MSDNINIRYLNPDDRETRTLLCQWYELEWHIPPEATLERLADTHPEAQAPFHRILYKNDVPVATGGLHTVVNILKIHPELERYGPWISLLYSVPELRGKGIGALLCTDITELARQAGFSAIYLYTYTAESLYARLGWETIDSLPYKGYENALMRKQL